jgi:hypothetical protein
MFIVSYGFIFFIIIVGYGFHSLNSFEIKLGNQKSKPTIHPTYYP